MPFIEEEKFSLMQQDLDNAKLKREEAENKLQKVTDDKSRLKKASIFIGALLGLALTAVGYFYNNGGGKGLNILKEPKVDIAAIKANEAKRVLDSVKKAQPKVKASQSNSNLNVNETVDELGKTTKGNTIYSVQIGVFSTKKYPLISKKFIPGNITATNGYFKYSLGLFSTVNEAKKLRNELRKIGFKDAFVASYVNGKRQKIHH